MLDLVGYDSSDDEVEHKAPSSNSQIRDQELLGPTAQINQSEAPSSTTQLDEQTQPTTDIAPAGPVLGPASINMAPLSEDQHTLSGRTSPFSASRALVQDLTLPPVPNLEIPPSPPGSPNPALNAKFDHFLSLKKQGVHFNSKLASSTSLKNPSLLSNMMTHAGIGEQSQYDTALPTDVWSTSTLPHWGFKGELLRTQHEMRRKTEEQKSSGQRTSVDFVSGSA